MANTCLCENVVHEFDISMSAQPLFDAKQIQRKDMKLAMSVGKKRLYCIYEIQPRHFQKIAERAGLPDGMAAMALDHIAETLPEAMETVCASLPPDFPDEIRDSIAAGALKRREVIVAAVA